MENLSINVNFDKLLNLAILLNSIRAININQCFDIYQSWDIYKYHITNQQYLNFQEDVPSIQKYYDNELEVPEHKGKFINNLLLESISNNHLDTHIISKLIEIFLENDSAVFGDDYSKYSVLNNLTNPLIINEMTDSLCNNLLQEKALGFNFIKKVLEIFIDETKESEYNEKNIFILISNYLTSLDDKSLDAKLTHLYEMIDYHYDISKFLELYKVLYSFSKKLLLPYNHLRLMFHLQDIQSIEKLINYLKIDNLNNFIKDEGRHNIMINDTSFYITGKELKEKLNNLKQ